MLREALDLLVPAEGERLVPVAAQVHPVYVDCTFGGGGYARAILERAPNARVLALDADRAAWERAQDLVAQYSGRLVAVHRNFADLDRALDDADVDEVDGVVYDLGISSLQLADGERGFGFAADAPLDMRLDPSSSMPTAADLLNSLSETDIANLLFRYADERNSRRIARQIVRRRERSPLKRTGDLVAAVLSALPAGSAERHARIHPATRSFQALRIAVNDELAALERSLAAAAQRTKQCGRVVVVSFHSGEDRVVKRTFVSWRANGIANILTPKPLQPDRSEVETNPRSRSAKLRAAEKIGDVSLPQEAA